MRQGSYFQMERGYNAIDEAFPELATFALPIKAKANDLLWLDTKSRYK